MQWTFDTKNSRKAMNTGLIAGGLLCGMLVVVGCEKEKPVPPPPPTVEVTTVTVQDVPIYKEWIGTLDGNVNAVIRPQVSGYLVKQNYREGEPVKKGQVLFEIDPRTFQASLNQAKGQLAQQQARYDTSKANLARIKPLAAKNAVSQKDLDDATGSELSSRSSVETAQAALENAQLNLSFTKITSPVDGIAGIAKTQLGNLVGPSSSQELTTVSSVNPIKAFINISEREYLSAKEGRKNVESIVLELILADGSVYPHKGRFSLADRQVDPATGTLKLGTLFANQNNLLRPGQYGRVRAAVGVRKAALLVPQRAVAEMQGKYLVTVIKADNTADIRPVKVAEQVGTQWVITEGLQPGDKIVVEGIQKVRPGSPVNPQPFVPKAPQAQAKIDPAATEAKPAAPAKQEKR